MIQDITTEKPNTGVITIHDIPSSEFIKGIITGYFNECDVYNYCENQPHLMALFKSLMKAASNLIQSKGIDGGYIWNLTERRYDFDNSKDLRLYTDAEFVRLQNAMGIVCDLIEKLPTDEQAAYAQQLPDKLNTDEAKRYFAKAIELGLMTDNYKWLKGLQMLACFARDFSMKLSLGKGNRISWKPFESLFGIEPGKLRLNYNDIQKTGQNPSESDLIDKVFE